MAGLHFSSTNLKVRPAPAPPRPRASTERLERVSCGRQPARAAQKASTCQSALNKPRQIGMAASDAADEAKVVKIQQVVFSTPSIPY